MRLPTEDTVDILDVCPDVDSDAFLVADNANRCVKAVTTSGSAALVFQCRNDSRPRALQLVRPVAGGGVALLLVERLKVVHQVASYELVVATRSGQRFDETRQLPLPALAKEDPYATFSMGTTSSGFVLIGNEKAKALEIIDARDSSGIERLAAPLSLDFALWHFSVGAADGRELLAATDDSTRAVRILELKADALTGALTLRPFAHLNAGDQGHWPSQVLLFGRHVLLCMWHDSIQSDAVECLPVSGAPLRPQVLSAEQQVRVKCWRTAGERVVLFDSNRKQLLSLAYADFEILCSVLFSVSSHIPFCYESHKFII